MTSIVTRLAKRSKRKGVVDIFLIDETDALFVDSFRYWYSTDAGYIYTMTEGVKRHWLTQLLLGKRPGFEIDHIDRTPLNNSRSNLRFLTHSDNMANCGVRRHSKSGLKGVRYHEQSGLWRANTHVNGRTKSLGYFHLKEEAIGVAAAGHLYFHPGLFP